MGLGEILIGVFAILVGGLFAFQGGNMLRLLFPLVGFFAGFSAGAGLVTGITGDGFLSTVLSWAVGFFVAILFAILAYFFYSFAIVLAFAGLGFSLAAAFLSLFNMDWNWLVIIVGSVTGAAFALFAILGSLPMTVLIVASSFFGSSMIIYGLLLVFNSVSFGDFSSGEVYRIIKANAGIYILWLTTAITGSIVQLRILGEQTKMAQEYWNSSMTLEDFAKLETNTKSTKKSKK
jgi:hypothetical protein